MLKIPSTISKIESLADGTWKLSVETQELHPDDEAELVKLKRQLGYFVFAVQENIEVSDIPTEKLEFPNDKSMGQRLRAVLYRLWEQNPGGYKEFEGFYRAKMNSLIEQIKDKLL